MILSKTSGQSGTSLIEATIAACTSALFLGSLFTMNMTAMRTMRTAREAANASQVLQQRVESMRIANWHQVTNADWVKNIGRQPRVRVRIAGVWYAGSAAVVEGHPDDLPARQALAAKYYGWRGGSLPNAWAREALPVAIRIEADPVPSNGATG